MRVLIIEDEVRLAGTLQDLMELNGYTADVSHDGEAGLDNALSGIYDVVLLDVMLPKLDGFGVLKRLRAAGNAVPVLMLTARDQVSDKVEGLDCGADYYLTKPFDPKELLACVRALVRRQPRSVRLSRKEFDIMELLMRNRNLVITKESLLLKVWGYESDAEDNNVEVYISFLRKKLSHLHAAVKIRTIRMVGYCLEAEEG